MSAQDPNATAKRKDADAEVAPGGEDAQVEGEGSYTAARQYNDATRAFVASGKVDAAAEAARPESEAEARELRDAEAEGRAHRKEEDPQVDGGRSRSGARDDA